MVLDFGISAIRTREQLSSTGLTALRDVAAAYDVLEHIVTNATALSVGADAEV
jgi:hypothetical protein